MKKEVSVLTDLFCEIPGELLKGVDIGFIGGDVLLRNGSHREDSISWLLLKAVLLKESPLPKTSAPTPGVFLDKYHERLTGAKSVFSIHISSELTGTVNGARFASSLETLPVEVFDSRTMGMAEGFIALEAARVANLGGSMQEVREIAGKTSSRVGLGILAYPQKPMIESRRFPGLEERLTGETVFISMNGGFARIENSCVSSEEASEALLRWLKVNTNSSKVRMAIAADWRIAKEERFKLLEKIRSSINIGDPVYTNLGSPIWSIHLGKAVRVAYLLDEV